MLGNRFEFGLDKWDKKSINKTAQRKKTDASDAYEMFTCDLVNTLLVGGFKDFLFSPLFGEMIPFD